MQTLSVLLLSAFITGVEADIAIATFDGAEGTTLTWKPLNDPVMGGKSTGTVIVDSAIQLVNWNGHVAIVPFLHAPGNIEATAKGKTNDVSSCKNLVFTVNSKTDYKGFKVSFSYDRYPGMPFYQHGYKANFTNFDASIGHFGDVVIPFSDFTLNWEAGTGKIVTECKDDKKACVTQKSLKDLQFISIWAEGVVGDVSMQIKGIRATECTVVV
jgi:hypothetical protein